MTDGGDRNERYHANPCSRRPYFRQATNSPLTSECLVVTETGHELLGGFAREVLLSSRARGRPRACQTAMVGAIIGAAAGSPSRPRPDRERSNVQGISGASYAG